ncbi:hypothetical protein [Halomonas sp. 3D7M]|uniref:hypothetical protein n=1 Tax=Halomonas sp. 3D7M TaxID=2742617 RepID=UPI001866A0E7|nr:hypothetical protein [Halomonas sp. 3D7M]
MATMFHFKDVSELYRYSKFSAQPQSGQTWSVIGQDQQQAQVVVAEGFQNQRYATLFVELCECVTGKKG